MENKLTLYGITAELNAILAAIEDNGGEITPEIENAIDFDKERIADNLGELIIIGRQVAKALEALVEIDRERNELYREWLAIKKVYPTTPRPRPRGTGATMAIKDPFAC